MNWEKIMKNSYRDDSPYNLDDMIETLSMVMKQLEHIGRTTHSNELHDIWSYLIELRDGKLEED